MRPAYSIAECIEAFRRSKNPTAMLKALREVIAQRRTIEAMYGAYCFALYRPSPISTPSCAPSVLAAAVKAGHDLPLQEIVVEDLPGVGPQHFRTRLESIAQKGDSVLLGEYASDSARMVLLSRSGVLVSTYYNGQNGVRHLHSIAEGEGDNVFVSTGDSTKRLDEWEIHSGKMYFRRSIIRYTGGFTASAKVRGELYFGTDFSGRPNYLLRMSDRRKFPLPRPAFSHFVYAMRPYLSRYIICRCKAVDTVFLSDELIQGRAGHTIAIFDTAEEGYIYADVAPQPMVALEAISSRLSSYVDRAPQRLFEEKHGAIPV